MNVSRVARGFAVVHAENPGTGHTITIVVNGTQHELNKKDDDEISYEISSASLPQGVSIVNGTALELRADPVQDRKA